MRSALVRAVRTYLQTFVGLLVVGWADVTKVGDVLSVGRSAAVAAVPAVLSLIQNALEDNTPVQIPKG